MDVQGRSQHPTLQQSFYALRILLPLSEVIVFTMPAIGFSMSITASLTFGQRHYRLLVVLAYDSIYFSVTEPLFVINQLGTFINYCPIKQVIRPAIILAITLFSFLLVAQMLAQVSARLFIRKTILINRLMADASNLCRQYPF